MSDTTEPQEKPYRSGKNGMETRISQNSWVEIYMGMPKEFRERVRLDHISWETYGKVGKILGYESLLNAFSDLLSDPDPFIRNKAFQYLCYRIKNLNKPMRAFLLAGRQWERQRNQFTNAIDAIEKKELQERRREERYVKDLALDVS